MIESLIAILIVLVIWVLIFLRIHNGRIKALEVAGKEKSINKMGNVKKAKK